MPIVALLGAALVISLAIAGIVAIGAALLAGAILFGIGYGVYYLINEKTKANQLAEQEALRQQEIQQLTDQSNVKLLTEEEFTRNFAAAFDLVLKRKQIPIPPRGVLEQIFDIVRTIYSRQLPRPPADSSDAALRAAAFTRTHFEQNGQFDIAEACLHAFTDFAAALTQPKGSQFALPLAELIDLPAATWNVIQPFRNDKLYTAGLCTYIWDAFHANSVKIGKGNAPVYPQELESDWSRQRIAHLYLQNTPFDQLFQTLMPFGFDDVERCTHHWCLGHNGTGKTTYLRHFIRADLERVINGECSLVVIDSKKLIREMRTLRIFAHELKDRVLIVDPEHPIALNPFYLPKKQSRDVIRYMLANISEASGLQTGALSFLADAAATYDKPSLYTIRDFFTLKKGELPDHFDRFDHDTQTWFRSTFSDLPHLTRSGINQRLANFIKENEALCKMLCADRCALDVFNWLHEGGKVLLVDTDRADDTPEATNVLGRLFIALLDQVSSRRTKYDEQTLKPIFCYLDEAMDYIERDTRFAAILYKARAQKVSMTVAHHTKGQIDPKIQDALSQAGIESYCPDRAVVQVKTRKRDYTLPIKPLDFHKQPQMRPDEYRAMRKRMDERYGASAQPREPTPTLDVSNPVMKID